MVVCVRSVFKDFGVSQKFYTEAFWCVPKNSIYTQILGQGVCVCVMTQEGKSVFQFCCLKRCSEDSTAFVRLAFLCEWLKRFKETVTQTYLWETGLPQGYQPSTFVDDDGVVFPGSTEKVSGTTVRITAQQRKRKAHSLTPSCVLVIF